MIIKHLRTSVVMLIALTAVTGVIYPLLITGVGQIAFPSMANGSLVERDGKTVGSELIGQPFDRPQYFWGRPSGTQAFPYDASASSGSNLGPQNPDLLESVRHRVRALKAVDSLNTRPVPVDLVTSSGSGLDPHISVLAALYQVPRVARARGVSEERVRALIQQHTEGRQFGLLGEPRVNVLLLNVDLDDTLTGSAGR